MAEELHDQVAGRVDARAARGLDRGRPGRRHRLPPGQGRGDRGDQRRAARPRVAARGRRRGRHRHRGEPRGPVHDPALHGPRAGPGRARPLPGRHVRHRPTGRGRLLLRLRAAGRGHVRRGGPRAHRGADARAHRRVAAVRARPPVGSGGPQGLRRPQVQARDHRRRQHRPDVGHVVDGVRPHLREPARLARRARRRSRATPGSSTSAAGPTCRTRAGTSATSS